VWLIPSANLVAELFHFARIAAILFSYAGKRFGSDFVFAVDVCAQRGNAVFNQVVVFAPKTAQK
jgi:hypothetical protein